MRIQDMKSLEERKESRIKKSPFYLKPFVYMSYSNIGFISKIGDFVLYKFDINFIPIFLVICCFLYLIIEIVHMSFFATESTYSQLSKSGEAIPIYNRDGSVSYIYLPESQSDEQLRKEIEDEIRAEIEAEYKLRKEIEEEIRKDYESSVSIEVYNP